MSPGEARKLLGGYSAGTLTPEERKALFEAALEDSELFELLMEEQPLLEVLTDPAMRAELLGALDSHEKGWLARFWNNVLKPVPVALAGSVAVAALAFFVVYRFDHTEIRQPELVAQSHRPMLSETTPAEAPAPEPPAPKQSAMPSPEVRRKAEVLPERAASARAPVLPPPPAIPVERELRSASKAVSPMFAERDLSSVPPPPGKSELSRAPRLSGAPGGVVGGVVGGVPGALGGYAAEPQAPAAPPSASAWFYGRAISPVQPMSGFRQPAPTAAITRHADTTARLGLRYSVVPSQQGARLQVQPNEPAFLQVLGRSIAGPWRLVHQGYIKKWDSLLIPAPLAGQSHILLILTRKRDPGFAIEPDSPAQAGSLAIRALEAAAAAPPLVEQSAASTYVIAPESHPDRLIKEFDITGAKQQ